MATRKYSHPSPLLYHPRDIAVENIFCRHKNKASNIGFEEQKWQNTVNLNLFFPLLSLLFLKIAVMHSKTWFFYGYLKFIVHGRYWAMGAAILYYPSYRAFSSVEETVLAARARDGCIHCICRREIRAGEAQSNFPAVLKGSLTVINYPHPIRVKVGSDLYAWNISILALFQCLCEQ